MSTGQVVRSVTDRSTATERAIMTDSHCTLIMKSLAPSPGRKASLQDWSAEVVIPERAAVSALQSPPGTANRANLIEQAWRCNGRSSRRRRTRVPQSQETNTSPASRPSGKRHRPSDLYLCPTGNLCSGHPPNCDGSTVELFKKVVVSDFQVGKVGMVRMAPNRPLARAPIRPSKPRFCGQVFSKDS
jgi:hypothetical protein